MPSRLEPVLDHNILDHNFFDQNVVYHNVVYDYHNPVQNVVYDDHFELSYAYLDYVGCRSRTVRRTRVRAARLPVRLCLRNHQPVLQPVLAGCALGHVHDHDQEYLDDQFVRHTVCDPVSDVQPRLRKFSASQRSVLVSSPLTPPPSSRRLDRMAARRTPSATPVSPSRQAKLSRREVTSITKRSRNRSTRPVRRTPNREQGGPRAGSAATLTRTTTNRAGSTSVATSSTLARRRRPSLVVTAS